MKYYFLIITLRLYSICGRLTFKQLENIQNNRIETACGDVAINPEGPLNFLRGYLFHKGSYMYNKRMFSSGIDADYAIEMDCNKRRKDRIYTFKRSPYNDKAYSSIDENGTESYTSQYHACLIAMFPSVHGSLSIETHKENSFATFLADDLVSEQVHYILGSLLLLSEGVDVPIDSIINAEGSTETIILRKKTDKNVPFFQLGTRIPVGRSLDNNVILQEQYDAVDIIRFFLASKKNIKEPTIFCQFKKGEFLDGLPFLIQTYIFEFIETEESAKNFIDAVYEILCDIVPKQGEDLPKRVCTLFSKFFVLANSLTRETNYLHLLKRVKQIIGPFHSFLFADSSELPAYTRVPSYKRTSNLFLQNQLDYFNNHVENSLYIMICSLIYNPRTSEYSLDSIPDASPELQEFFTTYNRPIENTNFTLHKDWNRVVSDLNCTAANVLPKEVRTTIVSMVTAIPHYFLDASGKSILYKKNENELLPGLLNLLFVICKITGKFTNADKGILSSFLERVHKNRKLSSKFYAELSKYVKDTLKSVCVYDGVEVICKNLKKEKREDGTFDIFGQLTIKYENSQNMYNMNCGVEVFLCKDRISTYLLHDSAGVILTKKEELLQIQAESEGKHTFLGCLIAQHIQSYIDRANFKVTKFIEKDIIEEIAACSLNSVNPILLLGALENCAYKRCIMTYALCYAQGNLELDAESPIIRFTSNIIASNLDIDWCAHIQFLCIPVYIKIETDLYPRVHLTGSEYEKQVTELFTEFELVLQYALGSACPQALANALTMQIKLFQERSIINCVLSSPHKILRTFDCLFKYNTLDYSEQILAAYAVYRKDIGIGLESMIRLTWFIIACQRKSDDLAFIKVLYDSIEIYPVFSIQYYTDFPYSMRSIISSFYRFFEENAQGILHFIKERENALAQEEKDIHRFRCIHKIFSDIEDLHKISMNWNSGCLTVDFM